MASLELELGYPLIYPISAMPAAASLTAPPPVAAVTEPPRTAPVKGQLPVFALSIRMSANIVGF